jgi:hypothetical protein
MTVVAKSLSVFLKESVPLHQQNGSDFLYNALLAFGIVLH